MHSFFDTQPSNLDSCHEADVSVTLIMKTVSAELLRVGRLEICLSKTEFFKILMNLLSLRCYFCQMNFHRNTRLRPIRNCLEYSKILQLDATH
jgi:hypothetical protein